MKIIRALVRFFSSTPQNAWPLMLLAYGAVPFMEAQIPVPQLNLTGNIGCQGFPCVNVGTLIMASDANRTVTSQETSAFSMKVTSSVSLTATRNLVFPVGKFPVDVENATTGGQSIQVIGASGTGVTIPNGQTVRVWNDGTNFVQVGASGSGSGAVSGQAANTVPLGTSPTVIGAQSHITDDGTKVTISEPTQFTGTVTPTAGQGQIGVSGGNVMSSDNGAAAARVCNATNGVCAGGSPAFSAITSGTNTTAAMVVGSGASLRVPTQSFGDSSTLAASDAFVLANVTPVSLVTKYMSLACAGMQNANPNSGGGTDATACINALFAGANPTTTIDVVQDQGFSLVSGNGILCPAKGNCILEGKGGGIAQTQITNCSISGGVAILTAANTLTAGESGTFGDMTHCPTLTNSTFTVLSAGLSSSQFEISASGSVSSGADSGYFAQVYGTGFFLASGSRDMFSNGPWGTGTVCEVNPGAVPQRGANIQVLNVVLNGNAPGNTDYCFGVDINNINGVVIRNVTFFNAAKYSTKTSNVGNMVLDSNTYWSTSPLAGTNTDGNHIEGPTNDIYISNSHYKVSDDAIALNAIEGLCGPITRVEITNSTLDNSFNALRAYNSDTNACGNGLVPLISKVDINNFSGSVLHAITFGAGETGLGTLNPAITDFHWANSTVEQTGVVADPVLQQDNIGDITFDDFTLRGNQSFVFWNIGNRADATPAHLGQLKLDNFTVVNTAAGSGTNNLFAFQNNLIGSIQVDGLSYVNDGGSGVMHPFQPFGSTTATVGQLAIGKIDYTNIANLFGATPTDYIPSVYSVVYPIEAQASFDGTYIQIPQHINLGASHVLIAGGITDIALGTSTSPICPNGSGGALTTSGCAGGSWNGGTVTNPVFVNSGPTGAFRVGTGALNSVATAFISSGTGDPPLVLAGGSCASSIWRDLTPTSAVSYGCAIPGGAVSDDWHFGAYLASRGSWLDRMDIINATGDVLIGTTTDDTVNKLQVNGGFKATNVTDSVLTTAPTCAVSGLLGDCSTTGTGSIVRATSPTLVTPVLGVASATSLALSSTGVLGWNSDTGLSRISAGVIALGNGTAGDLSATLDLKTLNAINGHLVVSGTDIPTISSCGGGALTGLSTDNSFQITGISATTSSCTVTFTFPVNQGFCTANAIDSASTLALISQGSTSTSSAVVFKFTPSATNPTTITAHCL